ncbi:uncharacterized protein LOC118675834 [Myotis myotis]|uniref:uncharacterized protein LOC118675834 n=1 Tax=Myotis myotis TaxID=51298 RepID=UPI00174DDCD6|nr:uncharacterized protein LOC118675834 [Myotis myotis]
MSEDLSAPLWLLQVTLRILPGELHVFPGLLDPPETAEARRVRCQVRASFPGLSGGRRPLPTIHRSKGPASGLTGRILGFWLLQSWACAEPGVCGAGRVRSRACAELGVCRAGELGTGHRWPSPGIRQELELSRKPPGAASGTCSCSAWPGARVQGGRRGRVLLRRPRPPIRTGLDRGIHTARWGQGLHIPARPGEAGLRAQLPSPAGSRPCDPNWAQAASGTCTVTPIGGPLAHICLQPAPLSPRLLLKDGTEARGRVGHPGVWTSLWAAVALALTDVTGSLAVEAVTALAAALRVPRPVQAAEGPADTGPGLRA